MNTITDAGRKTSITSLLNPEASSAALSSGFSHLAHTPMSSGMAANHQAQASSQSVGLYEAQHYNAHATTNGASFHLRAADWGVSDDGHEFNATNGSPRYQPAPQPYNPKDQNDDCSPRPATSPRTRASPHDYARTPTWPPPTPTPSAISYGAPVVPMYSDERTALSGSYQHHAASAYTTAYTGKDACNMTKPAREQLQGYPEHAVYPAAIIYAPYVISASPTMPKPVDQSGLAARVISPPAAQAAQTAQATQNQNKRPVSEESDPGSSRNKKAKGNANPNANGNNKTSTPAPSKRGYNAKKRNEAAQIAAQNAAGMIPNVSYTAVSDDKGKQKADSRMQIVPTESGQPTPVNTPMGPLTPEMQFARCMSNRYKNDNFPRCVSCTRRWAGDTCRFQGIRFFLKNAKKELVGVSFLEAQKEDAPSMEFPSVWNIKLDKRHIERTKRTIAKALLPILQKEQAHTKLADIIHRPRESDVRATCDTCMTSIFSSSWMCRLCGREACAECYATVRELTAERPGANAMEVAALQAKRERHAHSNPFFLSCTRRNEHNSRDFSPVSRFSDVELANAVKDMEKLLGVEKPELGPGPTPATESTETINSKEGGDKDGNKEEENNESESTEGVTKEGGKKEGGNVPEQQEGEKELDAIQVDPSTVVDMVVDSPTEPIAELAKAAAAGTVAEPPIETPAEISAIITGPLPERIEAEIYEPNCLSEMTRSVPSLQLPRYRDEDLTEETFPTLWAQGLPLVVGDVGKKFKIDWTPSYFKDKHGPESCLIIECQTEVNKKINVGEFFSKFGQYENRHQYWKLKDWPMSTDFKTAYPELYEDFSKAVPVPSYVRRDGVLNIASHFPYNTISPDLGPKMYNAMASSLSAGSKGSTRLHMDMADALNIMTYAEPCPDGSEGCAAWDLFIAEDSAKIRKFLIDKFGPGKAKGANGNTTPTGENGSTTTVKQTGQEWTGHTDPIHAQYFYLDEDLRKELYETVGVKSYRHYQRPGEAIFIPAGCAHQVANLADCIKVAVDYVSPENVERCERLTREFREQNQRKVWKEDVLQLRTMMWFAWLSCCLQEK